MINSEGKPALWFPATPNQPPGPAIAPRGLPSLHGHPKKIADRRRIFFPSPGSPNTLHDVGCSNDKPKALSGERRQHPTTQPPCKIPFCSTFADSKPPCSTPSPRPAPTSSRPTAPLLAEPEFFRAATLIPGGRADFFHGNRIFPSQGSRLLINLSLRFIPEAIRPRVAQGGARSQTQPECKP